MNGLGRHSVPEGRIQAQWPLQTPCWLSNGPRTQEGVQRISDANIRHGRQTKDKLAARRNALKVGRQVRVN